MQKQSLTLRLEACPVTRWLVVMLCMAMAGGGWAGPLRPVVEAEEEVYTVMPADNGAGPMWCKGSTCLVRIGSDLFASGLETLPDLKPLNNCRWTLYQRTGQGWQLAARDEKGRTREPCPLGGFADGRLFLSANPTLTDPNVYNGDSLPEVLQFSAQEPGRPPVVELPSWPGHPYFTEHSYRGFAADGVNGELLLLNIEQHEAQFWSFRDRRGHWSAKGKLEFPMGTDYEKPEKIRLCYPVVALRDRAAFVLGVSDIIEPVAAWRQFKRELTGQEWDYDFRRLFFTWTPDVTKAPFAPWQEIASRERTAGGIDNLDVYLAADGAAHVLWNERNLDERLRAKFFPGEKQGYALNHCVVRDGKVVSRSTVSSWTEGDPAPAPTPGVGRFHVTPDGRLLVIYYCSGVGADGKSIAENRLVELVGGKWSKPVTVPLRQPLSSFFTTTVRGGSPPSNAIELLGQVGNALRYARVRVE